MAKPVAVANNEVLGQGAVIELSEDGGTTYAVIDGVETIPKIGTEGEFIEVTSIDELTKTFIAGIKSPSEWELAFRRKGTSTVQDALIAAAVAGDTVKIKVTYQTGDIAVIDLVLNGYFADEAAQGGAVQMFAVKGQQTGDAVFSKVA